MFQKCPSHQQTPPPIQYLRQSHKKGLNWKDNTLENPSKPVLGSPSSQRALQRASPWQCAPVARLLPPQLKDIEGTQKGALLRVAWVEKCHSQHQCHWCHLVAVACQWQKSPSQSLAARDGGRMAVR